MPQAVWLSLLQLQGFFLTVLLAVVDTNYKFMFIKVGYYGKEGDSRIFKRSSLGKMFYGTLLPLPPMLPCAAPHICWWWCFPGNIQTCWNTCSSRCSPLQEHAVGDNLKVCILNYRFSCTHWNSENAFVSLSQVFCIFTLQSIYSPKSWTMLWVWIALVRFILS